MCAHVYVQTCSRVSVHVLCIYTQEKVCWMIGGLKGKMVGEMTKSLTSFLPFLSSLLCHDTALWWSGWCMGLNSNKMWEEVVSSKLKLMSVSF